MTTLIIIIVFVLLGLFIGLIKIKPGKNKEEQYPYESRNYLLTKSELHFYKHLNHIATKSNLVVMSKVRLWDLIFVSKGTEKRITYENKIKSKHIDFILCEPEHLRPLLAIELDDSSHNRPDRKQSDVLKENALAAANLPLYRIQVQRNYEINELAKQILLKLNKQ